MSEFNYGDPLPLPVDRKKGKRGADERAARHYAEQLSEVESLYTLGSNAATSALSMYDVELANLRKWQRWAAQQFTTNPNDTFAAEMCREYATPSAGGSYLADLRLHASERTYWQEVSLAACRRLGDRMHECDSLLGLSCARSPLGDMQAAVGHAEQALAVSQEICDRYRVGLALSELGALKSALGEYKAALGLFDQALPIFQEIGNRRCVGRIVSNFGATLNSLGKVEAAVPVFDHALTIFQELGDRRAIGQLLNNLGGACATLGDARAAVAYFDQALVIAREIGDYGAEGTALHNLGKLWSNLGDHKTAVGYFDQALAVTRKIGNRRGEAFTLYGLAGVIHAVGQRTEAIKCAEDALAILRAVGSRTADIVQKAIITWTHQLNEARPPSLGSCREVTSQPSQPTTNSDHSPASVRPSYGGSPAHPCADPDGEMRRNSARNQAINRWLALPRWRRWFTPYPTMPEDAKRPGE
jgi:tetratricopeptide (TPR) repeat protein